jgi:hypothetical protein
LTRCASPPDNVVACCPNVIYPSPTSSSVFVCRSMGHSQNSTPCSTVISRTSLMIWSVVDLSVRGCTACPYRSFHQHPEGNSSHDPSPNSASFQAPFHIEGKAPAL